MNNPFSLEERCILVTGASSGIGRSVAVACAQMGAKVVVSGRDEARLNETLSSLVGEGNMAIIADLSSQDGIDHLVSQCPTINGIVHSAGISTICGVKYLDRALLENTTSINQFAPILLTSALLKKKKLQKKSSVVFIASMSGVFVGNIGETSYAASKAALSGFVKSAAFELAPQGIRVNAICPGVVETPLLNTSNETFSEEQLKETMLHRYPLKRFGKPEDVANGAIYLLSEASSWVTGINLLIDGGYCLS